MWYDDKQTKAMYEEDKKKLQTLALELRKKYPQLNIGLTIHNKVLRVEFYHGMPSDNNFEVDSIYLENVGSA